MLPKVSVLLPVFNSQEFLPAALDSLLTQSLGNIEVIAINDGSVDSSAVILENYAAGDARVSVYHQANRGLPATLNRGLALARGEYLARMDADDISCPRRLERQVEYLDNHPVVGVCGTWVETLSDANPVTWRYPVDDAGIRCHNLFSPALAHPTIMFRKTVVQSAGGYSLDWAVAEDYELWLRLSSATQFANLPEALLRLRLHGRQKGRRETQDGKMRAAMRVLHATELRKLGLEATDAELDLHGEIRAQSFAASRTFILRADAWLRKMRSANRASQYLPDSALSKLLAEKWWVICSQAAPQGWWAWRQFSGSPMYRYAPIGRRQKLHFALSCARQQLRRLVPA